MIKILFHHNGKAYLPELSAYRDYFSMIGGFCPYVWDGRSNIDVSQYDVIWKMMGIDFSPSPVGSRLLIHEYASLSTPPFPKIKNYIKTILNRKPNLRVFLNEDVRKNLKFTDGIQYVIRDMGIHQRFLMESNNVKEFDFAYVGSLHKRSGLVRTLIKLADCNPGQTFLIIGDVPKRKYPEFCQKKNIVLTGRISYSEVPNVLARAVYGLNLVPDKYPYNLQTSTKLLEYCALKLRVISTDYHWVRRFEQKTGAKFYFLRKGNYVVNIKDLSEYDFVIPCVDNYEWNQRIKDSGIKNYLLGLISSE